VVLVPEDQVASRLQGRRDEREQQPLAFHHIAMLWNGSAVKRPYLEGCSSFQTRIGSGPPKTRAVRGSPCATSGWPSAFESSHIETQTPAPQRCPAAHWLLDEHTQKPSVHWPFGAHWALVTQVPHVPLTQACPPPHWLLAEHEPQAPWTQASPPDCCVGPNAPIWLQSAYVEHAAHAPAIHACPFAQSAPDWHAPHCPTFARHPSPDWQSAAVEHEHTPLWQVAVGPHCEPDVHAPQTPAVHTLPRSQSMFEWQAGAQTPESHASPVAQSVLTEHVHCNVECVAVHWALGPHWLFDAQAPQDPPLQTSPAGH
jgi:hypothetical protein